MSTRAGSVDSTLSVSSFCSFTHSAVSDAPFEVQATRDGLQVQITVSDNGRWRAPTDEGRGRGLPLMRELMDEVDIDPGARGTTVTLRRRLRDLGDL